MVDPLAVSMVGARGETMAAPTARSTVAQMAVLLGDLMADARAAKKAGRWAVL